MIECYQETLGVGIEKKINKGFFFRQQISLLKFLFDLPLLEHHNIRPFGVNALNGESIIRYFFFFTSFFTSVRAEWKKSNETWDRY